MTLRRILVAFSLLLAVSFAASGCGTTEPAPGACQTTCDCPSNKEAPLTCAGEWRCNAASKTCEYVCPTACSGQVYTCPFGTDCNGTFCSERTVLECP